MDLIQNVHNLFDKHRPLSPSITSPDVRETTSTPTVSSFLSPEFPGSAEVQAMNSTGQHHPGPVGGTPASSQRSFSSILPDTKTASESRLTPSPTPLLSPPTRTPVVPDP